MEQPVAKTVRFGGDRVYTLDEHGFLAEQEQWDEEFADGTARQQGIHDGLTKEHWDFIHYIRQKAQTEKDLPLLVVACAENGLRLDKLKSLLSLPECLRGIGRIVSSRPRQLRNCGAVCLKCPAE